MKNFICDAMFLARPRDFDGSALRLVVDIA
jgi:hypothetical protein